MSQRPLLLAATAAVALLHGAAAASPSLADYKRLRALSIDLDGRMPTRAEIAAFERDPDLGRWIDAQLARGAHAPRLTRAYLDVLRLEVAPASLYTPTPSVLRRAKVLGPDNKEIYIYFRRGQRRARPETDGEFCLTEKETGLKIKPTNQIAPEGTPVPISKRALDDHTVLVRPWWLYEDDRAAAPSRRYGEAWRPGPLYRPIPALLHEPDGSPTVEVRVCREEASTAETGTLFASGRDAPVPAEALGRQSPAPADNLYAKQHRGEPVSCRSAAGYTMSADCGCGAALWACLPGDGNTKDPSGFILPSRAPLGMDAPFDETPQGYSAWHKLWWGEEAAQLLSHLFSEDRDLREVITGRSTWINGPLAQFYRFTAPSMTGGPAKRFGPVDTTSPLVDPSAVPRSLSPHDMDTWVRLPDRGPRSAGIATTPAFLLKYASRRARAAALYTTFLCKPFPAGKAALTPSSDPDLRNRPGCAGCHVRIEPLAAYFTRIPESDFSLLSQALFPVDNPLCRADDKGKPPYPCGPFYDPSFSDAGRALLRGAYAAPEHADLGPPGAAAEIAASPDFTSCAVSRVAEAFLGRPLTGEDSDLARSLALTFTQGGYRPRALVRAVLTSDAYARGASWGSAFLQTAKPEAAQ